MKAFWRWLTHLPLWTWAAAAGFSLACIFAALGSRKTRKPTATKTDVAHALNTITDDAIAQGTAQIAASKQRVADIHAEQSQDDAAQVRAAQTAGDKHAQIDSARSGADVDVVLYGRKLGPDPE